MLYLHLWHPMILIVMNDKFEISVQTILIRQSPENSYILDLIGSIYFAGQRRDLFLIY
jgi:hypothetical protein